MAVRTNILLLDSAAAMKPVYAQLAPLAAQAGAVLEMRTAPPAELAEVLRGRVFGAAIIGPDNIHTAAYLRELYRLAPSMQVLVLAAASDCATVQRELAKTLLVGTNWRCVAADDPALVQMLGEALRTTRQRQGLRTTLDRMNLQLAQRPVADAADYRRLVISDRYFAALLQSAADAIISLDARQRIQTWNRGAQDIFGYDESAVLGRPLAMLAGSNGSLLEALGAQVSGDRSARGVLQCRRADTVLIDVEFTLTGVPAALGEAMGIAVIARDVSERRSHERRVAAQYEVTRILAEAPSLDRAAPMLVAALCRSLDWQYGGVWEIGEAESLRLTSSWYAQDSYEPFARASAAREFVRGEGLPGATWQRDAPIWLKELDAEKNFPRAQAAAQVGLTGGIGLPIHAQGEVAMVLECFCAQRNRAADGALLELFASLASQIDQFVERRRVEMALAAERKRLAVTLQSIGDGVIATDTAGRVVLINAVAQTLTGWSQALAQGRPLAEVFRIVNENTRAPCENPVTKVLETGGIVGLANHTALIARDGSERAIADSGAPIRDDANKIIGVVLVFRDIDAQRKLEQEAARAQQLESIGILAGGIAHDFNNILTAILGNISLGKMYAHNRDADFALSEAERACLRARGLTHQLLTFARGGAPIKQAASLSDIVDETTAFVLSGANVRPRIHVEAGLWPVEVDVGQISQVLQNLLINAKQAMLDGGEVVVEADNFVATPAEWPSRQVGRYVRLRVRDTGIGIAPEHLPHIFDPYFTTKAGGTGLGLATVYSIVKRHEGYIEVDSSSQRGTTFTLYLPAQPEAVLAPPVIAAAPISGSGRILIMDDEATVAQVAAGLLAECGYHTAIALDGKECVEIYRRAHATDESFAAVILDLTVPGGMGGLQCLQHLRAFDAQVKALVSSGYSNDPIMSEYSRHGFRGVVAKPYRIQELAAAVHRALHED